jgi:HEAT repeat protein/TolA-binding protein
MKRITLTIVLLTAASVGIAANVTAQEPPRPPRPAPAPRVQPRIIDPQEIITPEIREQIEAVRIDADRIAREANIQAREMSREVERAAMEMSRVDMSEIRENVRVAMAPFAPMAMSFGGGDRFDHMLPPRAWAQGDPADSIYSLARNLLSGGDWGRSARMFADIQKNYPKSAYANDAQYWEAYARYKIGTTDELHAASRLLEPLASRISPNASASNNNNVTLRTTSGFGYTFNGQNRRSNDSDILGLYVRVNQALAQRGDSEAASKVAKFASMPGAQCDQEDIQVRSQALNALNQMDPAQALPILRRVIDKKDECTSSLRRDAVFILGRRSDQESASLLMNVAKSDPNMSVRTEAISFISRMPGDAGLNALEDMLRTEQDERIQSAAVRALMASDNPKARSSMRTLIDRKDAPIKLRIEAINSYNAERATTEDAAYLRGLYAKADNDRMKEAIVNTVSRIGGPENDQWVLGLIRNNNEPGSVRAIALSRLSRSPTVTTSELSKLYDSSAESYDVRTRIISILGNRKDQEATDKLIDIAKNGTVVNSRVQAINALRDKKDPRATQLLQDILDGKRP